MKGRKPEVEETSTQHTEQSQWQAQPSRTSDSTDRADGAFTRVDSVIRATEMP